MKHESKIETFSQKEFEKKVEDRIEKTLEREQASPHILNASSSLLGLCFLVLTSIRLLDLNSKTHIDEFTSAATLVFMASCVLSFLSIRSAHHKSGLEKWAVYSFMTGLCLLVVITLVVTFRNM